MLWADRRVFFLIGFYFAPQGPASAIIIMAKTHGVLTRCQATWVTSFNLLHLTERLVS